MRIKFLIKILTFFTVLTIAQSQSLKVSLDTNDVMIGDLIELNIQLLSSEKTDLLLPQIEVDAIEGLELLNQSELDTIKNGNSFGLSRRYTVSAYDSGSYIIPRIETVLNKGNLLDTIYSDSLILYFNSPAVDTSQAIKDIKGIYNVDYSDYSWIYLIATILLLIIIGILLYWLYKKRKDK